MKVCVSDFRSGAWEAKEHWRLQVCNFLIHGSAWGKGSAVLISQQQPVSFASPHFTA